MGFSFAKCRSMYMVKFLALLGAPYIYGIRSQNNFNFSSHELKSVSLIAFFMLNSDILLVFLSGKVLK